MKNTVFSLSFVCLSISVLFAQDPQKMSLAEIDSVFDVLFQQGKFEEMLPYGKEAVEKTRGIDSLYSEHLNNLSAVYRFLGRLEQCQELLIEAQKSDEKNNRTNSSDYARTLRNRGSLLSYLEHFEQAEPYLLTALEIQTKTIGKQDKEYAETLNELGHLSIAMGNYERAETFFLQTIDINDPKSVEYSISLNNLGLAYHYLGQLDKAQMYYQKAANLQDKNGRSYSFTVNNLASIFMEMKDYANAEKLYLESIAIRDRVFGKDHPEYPKAINNLAKLYSFTQQYDRARPLFWQAIRNREKNFGAKDANKALFIYNLAESYRLEGNLDSALFYANKAILTNCTSADSLPLDFTDYDKLEYVSDDRIIEILDLLKLILKSKYEQTADKKWLLTHYGLVQSIVRLTERLRNTFSSDKSKLRILSNTNRFISSGIQSALLLEQADNYRQMFTFADMNKSILLADAMKANRARALGDLPDSLALKEIALQEKADLLNKKQIAAKTKEEKEFINQNINELNIEIEAFKKILKDKHPKYHQLKYANISAKAEEIQALLNDKTLLLEYFLTDSLLYLFVLDKKEVRLLELKTNKKELDQQIALLRNALTNYEMIKNEPEKAYKTYTASAFWFYQQIVLPALENRKDNIQNIIVVSDGELGHLPFETFLTKEATNDGDYSGLNYLMRDYNISYNYSATLFKENYQSEKRKNNGKLIAFAADYDQLATANSTRSPHLLHLRKNLNKLPAAKAEVEAISALFSGEFLYGANTSETYFKSNSPQYSIIHLAMHGILNKRHPILSSLAFTENGDSTEDNFLEAWEIARMKLNADMVVLSACETGYGTFEQGEGVMSLARSFMYAGVPALVVSMWEVNDASTAKIMQFFYKKLKDGVNKDEALRQAKIQYLSEAKGTAAHPAYWSAFVQIGDNSPLTIDKLNYSLWIFGALGGVAVLAAFLAIRKRFVYRKG